MRVLAAFVVVLIARTAGAATFLSEIQTGPIWQFQPVVTPDGLFAYSDGSAFQRAPDGTLTYIEDFALAGTPRDVVLGSADGGFVYRASSIGIVVMQRDSMTGIPSVVDYEPGAPIFPFHKADFLAVTPDGTNLYGATGGGILTYTRDPNTGELLFTSEIEDADLPDASATFVHTTAIAVSPDSAHVYVAARDLLAFDRSGPAGTPSLVATYGLAGFYSLAFTADGLELYAGTSGGIARYLRNPATGELTFASLEPANQPVALAKLMDRTESLNITADGTRLVGLVQNYMVAYDRNPSTGALTLLTIERNPTKKVTMSADGVAVYSGAKFGSVYTFATFDCTPTPAAGCHTPAAAQRSAISLKHSEVDPSHDKLTWKIAPAGLTDLADFGDPITGGDDLVLCVYDASASPQPVVEAVIPARGTCDNDAPCWVSTSSGTNIKYSDSVGFPSGVQKFAARERAVDRGAIKLKAKGPALALPALPLSTPVRAQLQSRTGACWDATYTLARKNDLAKFLAKSD